MRPVGMLSFVFFFGISLVSPPSAQEQPSVLSSWKAEAAEWLEISVEDERLIIIRTLGLGEGQRVYEATYRLDGELNENLIRGSETEISRA